MRIACLALLIVAAGCHDLLWPSRGAPTAKLSVSGLALVGVPIELDASASSDPDGKLLTYQFTVDDGTPPAITASSVTRHVFRGKGAFIACVEVQSSLGLADSTCVNVQVAVPPDARIDRALDAGVDGARDRGLDKPIQLDKLKNDKPADKPKNDKPPDKPADKPKNDKPPDKAQLDKPQLDKAPDKAQPDQTLLPDKTLPDKTLLDKTPLDKTPSPDGGGCFSPEAGGTGTLGYALKMISACPIDISTLGTALGVTQDEQGMFAFLPFGFSFWGKTYGGVGVSSNGYLQFVGTNPLTLTVPTSAAIPSTSNPRNIIAAFWDDLAPSLGSPAPQVYTLTLGQSPSRIHIIQWTDWGFHLEPVPSQLIFSVLLYETSNVVELQYIKLSGGNRATGSNATVGIENEAGTQAVQVFHAKANGVATTYGLRFVPK